MIIEKEIVKRVTSDWNLETFRITPWITQNTILGIPMTSWFCFGSGLELGLVLERFRVGLGPESGPRFRFLY